MSMKLDADAKQNGTRFKLFPQPRFLDGFAEPEIVHINVPTNRIAAGPADDRMFVIDPLNKLPYEFDLPPFRGPVNVKVEAKNGHFDHLEPGTRAFSCATMYATVRRVLDIMEDYFGHRIEWHFRADFARMELIPLIDWDNAQSGYGFLEFGFGRTPGGARDFARPYCENFDVLAHELGHSIIFSQVGTPGSNATATADYGGFHESAGDLVALIASLHFDTMIDKLLARTRGNLFTANELTRVGELSASRQIRVAFNDTRMSDVGDEPHDRSLPLTGAIFDVMVEVFQKGLVAKGLITQDLADRANNGPGQGVSTEALQAEFSQAHGDNAAGFRATLLEARDYLGRLLARAWSSIGPDNLSYHDVLVALLDADREQTGGAHQETIRSCFQWRQITLPPHRASQLMHRYRVSDCAGQAHRTADLVEPAHT